MSIAFVVVVALLNSMLNCYIACTFIFVATRRLPAAVRLCHDDEKHVSRQQHFLEDGMADQPDISDSIIDTAKQAGRLTDDQAVSAPFPAQRLPPS